MFGGTRRFWLSRDPDGMNYDLHLARRSDPKPVVRPLCEGDHNPTFEGETNFCDKMFEKLFPTAKLEPGAVRRIKVTIEAV
jgi:hypothetical protein